MRVGSPFLLRSVEPPLAEAAGRRVERVSRLGKRVVFELEGGLRLVLHLMIAGRLHWRPRGAKVGGRGALAAFDFEDGSLVLTEAGTKRRASLHLVREDGVSALDRGGLEVLDSDLPAFRAALARENHTVKRALTDPQSLLGDRERLLRRDPAPRPFVAGAAHEPADRRRKPSGSGTRPARRSSEWSERLIGEARKAFPGKGHGVSRRDGGARTVREAVSRVRHADPADRVRRERIELLPDLPDRRQDFWPTARSRSSSRATGRRRSRSSRSERCDEARRFSRRLRCSLSSAAGAAAQTAPIPLPRTSRLRSSPGSATP